MRTFLQGFFCFVANCSCNRVEEIADQATDLLSSRIRLGRLIKGAANDERTLMHGLFITVNANSSCILSLSLWYLQVHCSLHKVSQSDRSLKGFSPSDTFKIFDALQYYGSIHCIAFPVANSHEVFKAK
jgi:hypothetical protein